MHQNVKVSFWVLFPVLLLAAFLSACQAGGRTDPRETTTADGARLRITNSGEVDIMDLVVLFPDQRIEFGTVLAGTTTDYQPAPGGVYNYAAYEFTHLEQTITQPVIDWVGEMPQMNGDFTYVLSYNPVTRITMESMEQP